MNKNYGLKYFWKLNLLDSDLKKNTFILKKSFFFKELDVFFFFDIKELDVKQMKIKKKKKPSNF